MTRDEATTILTGLTAAFPNVRLEEDTPDVWRKHLSTLDFDVADRAVGQCVNNLKFFPSIAEFREFYRLERHNSPKPVAREPIADDQIPVWVHVWEWHRRQTLTARQEASTMKGPVEDRVPVQMRDFPQFVDPDPQGYDLAEYEDLRSGWIAAGAPKFGAAEIIGGVAA